MAVAPSILRGRLVTTTYIYDDPDRPDRPTSTVVAPAWTEDDRSLLLALEKYEATLCPGCGQPKDVAWHADAEGEYEALHFVCHGCSSRQGGQATYSAFVAVPTPAKVAKFLPFDLLTTTTEPTREGAE